MQIHDLLQFTTILKIKTIARLKNMTACPSFLFTFELGSF